jgi:hypothetical protein
MPIEFNQDNKRAHSGPSIQFTQDIGSSHQPRKTNLNWLALSFLIAPMVGTLVGLFLLQESRHAKARGTTISVFYVGTLILLTTANLIFSLFLGLFIV